MFVSTYMFVNIWTMSCYLLKVSQTETLGLNVLAVSEGAIKSYIQSFDLFSA